MIRAAVQNPIAGLTLDKRLERNRAQIIYDIKKNIAIGLTQGDSYTTVAKRIAKSVNNDYTKAMLITRTETHRVREQGFEDSGRAAQNDLVGTGYVLSKTWQSMQDSSVRHTGDANHVKMDGVTVLADEDFELVGGVKAPCPGMSGTPQNDCNCRCYASRDFMSAKEFEKKTGRVLPEKYHKRKAEPEATEQEQSVVQDVKKNDLDIAGESGIIESNIGFRTLADPMREVMGPARVSHPKELADIIADLESSGVSIKYRDGTIGYFPPPLPGSPGDLSIERDASFSAWAHEYKHFCDDRDDGFLGLRILEYPEKCAKREIDAYQVEIEIAKQILQNELREEMIKRLEALRDAEIEKYGVE